jgi:hypothetical protein
VQALLVLVVVEEGLLLLWEVEEGRLLHLHLHQGHHLHHQVHLLLGLVPMVVVLVLVVAALGLELGELVCLLQLVLSLHFQTL